MQDVTIFFHGHERVIKGVHDVESRTTEHGLFEITLLNEDKTEKGKFFAAAGWAFTDSVIEEKFGAIQGGVYKRGQEFEPEWVPK